MRVELAQLVVQAQALQEDLLVAIPSSSSGACLDSRTLVVECAALLMSAMLWMSLWRSFTTESHGMSSTTKMSSAKLVEAVAPLALTGAQLVEAKAPRCRGVACARSATAQAFRSSRPNCLSRC